MKELQDEHGRTLAWLRQLDPEFEDEYKDIPHDQYGSPNVFVTRFLEEGETPPDKDEWGNEEDVDWTRRAPNCVTSFCPETSTHRLVLDLDFECRLIPSSSPGCYHLYLDGIDMSYAHAGKVVRAMTVAGILEQGFGRNMARDSQLCVRAENVKKRQPKPVKGEGRKVTRLRTEWE